LIFGHFKAGGINSARLLYSLLFCLSLAIPALAVTISGERGRVALGDLSQFTVTRTGNSVEILASVRGKNPEIPEDLKDFISLVDDGSLKISVPLDKDPVISVLKDSIMVEWVGPVSSSGSLFSSKDAPAYPLGPGDRLMVEVYGIEDMNKEVVVDPAGYVTLPLLERMSVKNMALNEIQKLLEEKYTDYIKDPKVNLQLKEYGSRFVNIIGEVERPGRIPLKSTFRLLDAISEAGGFTAKSGDIEVQRRDESGAMQKTVIMKESLLSSGGGNENIFVYDQDTVNILPVSQIYISGQVRTPQGIEYKRDLTLLRAIAKAGGFTEWANKDKIIILRQDQSGQTQAIRVDVHKIEKGKLSDPPLMPNDQIVVYERKLF